MHNDTVMMSANNNAQQHNTQQCGGMVTVSYSKDVWSGIMI